jgi:hypothetical protein
MAILRYACQSELDDACPCPEVANKVASTPWLTMRVCDRCYTVYHMMPCCCPEAGEVWQDDKGHTVTIVSLESPFVADPRQLVKYRYDGFDTATGGSLATVFCDNYTRKEDD